MEKKFSISETAKIVGMTTETLRHYDRIGLVKPCKTDNWTGYRYYSEHEIVILNTVRALRCMDLSLQEIQQILEYKDINKIVELLKKAEKNADNKIAEIKAAKSKIQKARIFYQSKLKTDKQNEECGIYIKELPRRVILLSEELEEPSLDNLWDYHRHFYKQIGEENKNLFSFEDTAGIYTPLTDAAAAGEARLFAICSKYTDIKGLKILSAGKYLCADCTEENSDKVLGELISSARQEYNISPEFYIKIIVLSGILQWNYQLQIYIG